ncbi:helix-turn-helix domain-containing protein [Mucilaginibacter sp. HD30]|jgi:transcriptional regulator with XRE-family HTH domain
MANPTTQEYLIQFGRHLKTLRTNKNLSLRKLATKCNIDHSDIVRYENGDINMSFNTLVELAQGLEVSLKELMDF